MEEDSRKRPKNDKGAKGLTIGRFLSFRARYD